MASNSQESNLQKLQEKYPPLDPDRVSERTSKAIALFRKIATESRKQNWNVVFLSGFAVDAHVGYLTRQHKDVDLMALPEIIPKIKLFLEQEGHTVYEPESIEGECLKVDQAEPDKPLRSHCDIHYYFSDEQGKAFMLHEGKQMKFTASALDASEDLTFLGETARFLKLQYLLEEKKGWHEQVGLTIWEENLSEIEKIKYLLELKN